MGGVQLGFLKLLYQPEPPIALLGTRRCTPNTTANAPASARSALRAAERRHAVLVRQTAAAPQQGVQAARPGVAVATFAARMRLRCCQAVNRPLTSPPPLPRHAPWSHAGAAARPPARRIAPTLAGAAAARPAARSAAAPGRKPALGAAHPFSDLFCVFWRLIGQHQRAVDGGSVLPPLSAAAASAQRATWRRPRQRQRHSEWEPSTSLP